MCKTRFRVTSMKGFPIEDIHDAIGEAKEFQSILRPKADEKSLLTRLGLYTTTEEDDVIDVVVDSWTQRLRKGNPIWFEGLWREDIEGRKGKPTEKNADAEKGNEDQETENAIITQLRELKDVMVTGFAQMGERADIMNTRLVHVEEKVTFLQNVLGYEGEENEAEENEGEENEGEENEGEENEAENDRAENEEADKEVAEKEEAEKEEEEKNEETPTSPTAPKVLEDDRPLLHYVRAKKKKKTYSNLRKEPFEVRETRSLKRAREDDA